MSLHWYACISTNTYCFEMHHILLGTNWWALSKTSLIVWICSAVHEILADEAFTATDSLISQSFVVAFVPLVYVWIALIWGFPAQLSLWKSVYWLWRYKLNEVCDSMMLFVLKSSTEFSQVLWSVLWLCYYVTDVTTWPINPNPSYSKNRKIKMKRKIK